MPLARLARKGTAVLGVALAVVVMGAPARAAKVGAPVKTPDARVTVHAVEVPAVEDSPFDPQPGSVFALVDAEVCARRTIHANPFDFEIAMADHTRSGGPMPSVRDPALNATTLHRRDCVRGWVTFQVPDDVRAVAVLYDADRFDDELVRWRIPKAS